MNKIKFLRCKHCGNLIEVVNESGVPIICCGEQMQQLSANSTDAAGEKHVPVIVQDGNQVTVTIGSVEHPMLAEHYIEWIYLVSKNGIQRVRLQPEQKPTAIFSLVDGDVVLGAYEYCNLHGLWSVNN